MIKLDLYRLLPELHMTGIDEEADVDCNYTPYRIFILETRLYPMIYKLLNKRFDFPIYIYPKSIYNKETYRMDVYLRIVDISSPDSEEDVVLTLEERQKIGDQINKITSQNINYALIDINELYDSISLKNKYPKDWFTSVIEYTGLDDKYNPFITEEGIYLTFDPNSEYKKDYYRVCEFLKNRIEEFYKKGSVVISGSKKDELIKNWNLQRVGDELSDSESNLYQPLWKDNRFAENLVDFLLRKIEEDPYIRIKLPRNLVKRHGIIKALQENQKACIIESDYIKIPADSLVEAQKIASLITWAENKTYGRVIVLASNTLAEIYLFFEYAAKYKIGESLSYSVSSNENPYLFSCLLSENKFFESSQNLSSRFRNYAMDRLIEVSKISKFQNMSPHHIIENELANL